MIVTLVGGTGQQRQWVEEAIRRVTYPLDRLAVNVTVTWPTEPPCPGHKEFACTTTPDGVNFAMSIREAFDSSTDPDYSGRTFYEETIVHELGHVITFARANLAAREAMCPWFMRRVSGEGIVHGVAAQLDNADDLWEDRIQEAMAETIKDAILPHGYRDYDNRTNWEIDPAHYDDFMTAMVPGDVTGTETIMKWGIPPGLIGGSPGSAHIPPEFPGDAGLDIVIDPTNILEGGPEGKTYTLRFRWAASDGAYMGFYDFEVIVPAHMVIRPWWDFGAVDTGGGIAVVHAGYTSWPEDGTEIADGVSLELGAGGGPSFNFNWWAQWSYLTPPEAAEAPPPYPYRDPFVAGGGGDTQVFRTQ